MGNDDSSSGSNDTDIGTTRLWTRDYGKVKLLHHLDKAKTRCEATSLRKQLDTG